MEWAEAATRPQRACQAWCEKVKPCPAPGTKRFVGSTAMREHASSRGAIGCHAAVAALFSSARKAYIDGCRREPAMAINGRRNKPIGPGGSTRRLQHQGVSDQEPQSEETSDCRLLITDL